MRFGQFLKELRQERQLTLEQVVSQVPYGKTPGWLWRIESADRSCSVEVLYALAEVYGMSGSELLLEYERRSAED